MGSLKAHIGIVHYSDCQFSSNMHKSRDKHKKLNYYLILLLFKQILIYIISELVTYDGEYEFAAN